METIMENPNPHDCCQDLFEGFTFDEISRSRPPARKGVYCIRIRKRGTPTEEIEAILADRIPGLRWGMVQDYLLDRIHRIHNIADCPVIYLGSAGTNANSRHTLAGRYQDFKKRHTVQYPLWALLYFGWDLDYGWMIADNPAEVESRLKQLYRDRHGGKLPALVSR
jgi:hypothetical protein